MSWWVSPCNAESKDGGRCWGGEKTQPSSSLWCKTAALLLFLSLRDSSFAALLNPSLEVSGNTNSSSTVYIRLHMNHRKMLSLPSVMQIRCIAEKMGNCVILFLCPPLLWTISHALPSNRLYCCLKGITEHYSRVRLLASDWISK